MTYNNVNFNNKSFDVNMSNGIRQSDNTLDNTLNGSIFDTKKPDEKKAAGNLPPDDPNVHVKTSSSVVFPKITKFFGKILNSVRNDEQTRDGVIGNTCQRYTGDCWLLADLNALSYCEAGQEIIKNAIEYTDGGAIVHFGDAGDYFISDDMIATAKGSIHYSTGDDDMVVFELAYESLRDDIINDKVIILGWNKGEYIPETGQTVRGRSSLRGGREGSAIELLTGNSSNIYCRDDVYPDQRDERIMVLSEFEQDNHKNIAMMISRETKTTVNDINGNKLTIFAPHAYTVKEVKDNVVTIINPHDSSVEINLDRETFLNTFDDLTTIDLSQKRNQLTINTKNATIETIETENGGYKEIIRRKENGELLCTKYYNSSGNCYNYELHENIDS